MKKLLGFLIVAVFVFAAAVNAYAVSKTVNAGVPKGAFTAEVVFADVLPTVSSFTVVLKTIGGTMVAGGDSEAGGIIWTGVTPGGSTNTWVTSKVYAQLSGNISRTQKVIVYTDNTKTSGNNYVFNVTTPSARTQMNALTKNNTTTFDETLPLVYKIVGDVDASSIAYTNYGMNPGVQANFGVFAVQDQQKTLFWSVATSTASIEYNEVYSTIMRGDTGYKAGFKGSGETGYVDNGNPRNENNYHWTSKMPHDKMYMFFASMFSKAQQGVSYGTDTLTFELITE
ncbi:MAG: hypothetical protein FWF00_05755 [Endomicrobia bacterium]|nr:hypothetical protein [Endomicrobiia bacterium]MCL2507173.1 hypothetical protein [Endomicrobiia bacterium]